MKINKILFIGLGGIGQRHLRNLSTKFGTDMISLAYRVRNLNQTVTPTLTIDENVNFIEKYSVKVYADLNDALSEKPNIAFICNPTSLHIDSCLAVARSGCDFFVEKPLSHSTEGVEELIAVCESKNLIGLVGYQLRFHPCYELFKKLVLQGTIGNLLSVHAKVGEYMPHWHKYEDYRQMYASRKNLGGGVVLSQIHEIDYLYDLLGMPNRVAASGGHLSSLEIDVEDVVIALLEMNFGGNVLPVSLHMDFIQRPPSRNCEIIGESGKITMDLSELKVVVEKYGEEKEIHDFGGFERNDLFIKEIDHFFDCITNRSQPNITIRDGANSLKIALAIKESMVTGETINLR